MAARAHLTAALREASPLRGLVRKGLAALKPADAELIALDQRPRIGESLDLDAATLAEHPQEHRWDYVASVADLAELVGIEPHAATDAEVSVVIRKKQQAVEHLRSQLRSGRRVARWYWVTHGPVGFSRMDKARRRLDQAGIQFAGRMLRSLG